MTHSNGDRNGNIVCLDMMKIKDEPIKELENLLSLFKNRNSDDFKLIEMDLSNLYNAANAFNNKLNVFREFGVSIQQEVYILSAPICPADKIISISENGDICVDIDSIKEFVHNQLAHNIDRLKKQEFNGLKEKGHDNGVVNMKSYLDLLSRIANEYSAKYRIISEFGDLHKK